jgi:hypothetical protein
MTPITMVPRCSNQIHKKVMSFSMIAPKGLEDGGGAAKVFQGQGNRLSL